MRIRELRQSHRVSEGFAGALLKRTAILHSFIKSVKGFSLHLSHKQQVEDTLQEVAEILANMVVIGKEKRNLCEYYDVLSGICKYLRIEIPVPSMSLVKDGNEYKPVVSIHPEVCAVCPFWFKKRI
ncbi:MAG: hypothetical protein QXL96_05035 [Ignisphaera sp.]